MIIFGLGIGVILLILLWFSVAISLLLVYQPLVYKTCFIIFASAISAILLLIPQQKEAPTQSYSFPIDKNEDEFFAVRVVTLLAVSLSAVGGLGIAVQYSSEPVMAMPLSKNKL